MTDETTAGTQWTATARDAYVARADELIDQLRKHIELTLSREGRQAEYADYFPSVASLSRAAAMFDDAEFDWCGTSALGVDAHDDVDDDDDGDSEKDEEPGSVLTVCGRWDYRVVDERAVIGAGRDAYTKVWPGDTEEDAAVTVRDLSSAVQEIVHDRGWSGLGTTNGLERLAYAARIIVHDDTEASWTENDEDPFAILGLS